MTRLTTKELWQSHWSGGNLKKIPKDFNFYKLLQEISKKIAADSNRTCIELGGFPGFFSIYFKKYCNLNPSLIDFYFDKNYFHELLKYNNLDIGDIRVINSDVLEYNPSENYDLVCSFGLIEHFEDLNLILKSHLKFLNEDGYLLITVPNFLGINGILQRIFDNNNYKIHNLKAMNIGTVEKILVKLGCSDVVASYFPTTQVWIENLSNRGVLLNILIRVLNKVIPIIAMIFGSQNKILSNNIFWVARLEHKK